VRECQTPACPPCRWFVGRDPLELIKLRRPAKGVKHVAELHGGCQCAAAGSLSAAMCGCLIGSPDSN